MLGDVELADGFRESYEYRMLRSAVVAGVEFALPLIEEFERGGGVSDFVAEIVGDAAVGVDVEEMLAQAAGKEPAGDGEIFVMRAGEAGAVFTGFGREWVRLREWRSARAGGTSRGRRGWLRDVSCTDDNSVFFHDRALRSASRRIGILRLRRRFAFANPLLRSG